MQGAARWNDRDLSHFPHTTGDDLFDVHHHFARWTAEARPGGYELYVQSLASGPTPRVQLRPRPTAIGELWIMPTDHA